MVSMIVSRLHSTFIIRVWCEPSELAPPGEWRGTLRRLNASEEIPFKSAEELWRHLLESEIIKEDVGDED